MSLERIVNSTGTQMNRYKLKKEDDSEEVVFLIHYPGDDFIQGSLFSAETINPIIEKVEEINDQYVVEITTSGFTKNSTSGYYEKTISNENSHEYTKAPLSLIHI